MTKFNILSFTAHKSKSLKTFSTACVFTINLKRFKRITTGDSVCTVTNIDKNSLQNTESSTFYELASSTFGVSYTRISNIVKIIYLYLTSSNFSYFHLKV